MSDTPNFQFKVGDIVLFNSSYNGLDPINPHEGKVVKVSEIYERDGQQYINFNSDDVGWYVERFQLYGESIVDRILTKYQDDL